MSFRYRVVDINLQSVQESREHVSYGPWHEDMKYPRMFAAFLNSKGRDAWIQTTSDEWYTADGRKLDKPPKGIGRIKKN